MLNAVSRSSHYFHMSFAVLYAIHYFNMLICCFLCHSLFLYLLSIVIYMCYLLFYHVPVIIYICHLLFQMSFIISICCFLYQTLFPYAIANRYFHMPFAVSHVKYAICCSVYQALYQYANQTSLCLGLHLN